MRLLCPLNLKYPIIGIPSKNGRVYAVCRTCALARRKRPCPGHSTEKRAFDVTITVVELVECVKMKYDILRMYEAALYTAKEPIFRQYMNLLIREKVIHSQVPQDSDCYISALNTKLGYDAPSMENLKVRSSDIQFNPMLRYIAKLSCNSISGKFGQTNDTRCVLVNSYEEIKSHYFSKSLLDLRCYTENECYLTLKKKKQKFNRNRHLVVAAYLTAFGRLSITRAINILDQNGAVPLYVDVDGLKVLVPKRSGLPKEIKVSGLPGEFKLEHGDKVVVCWVGAAPKSYSFIFIDQEKNMKEHVCCKGLSISNKTSKSILNYDAYKRHLFCFLQGMKCVTRVPQFRKLAIDNYSKEDLINSKKFCMISFTIDNLSKRNIDFTSPLLLTTPFGFHKDTDI